jgi:hypothetical protein
VDRSRSLAAKSLAALQLLSQLVAAHALVSVAMWQLPLRQLTPPRFTANVLAALAPMFVLIYASGVKRQERLLNKFPKLLVTHRSMTMSVVMTVLVSGANTVELDAAAAGAGAVVVAASLLLLLPPDCCCCCSSCGVGVVGLGIVWRCCTRALSIATEFSTRGLFIAAAVVGGVPSCSEHVEVPARDPWHAPRDILPHINLVRVVLSRSCSRVH